MDASRAALALLAATFALSLLAPPLVLLGWALAAASLAVLARRTPTRRAALVALGVLALVLAVALPAAATSLGFRGRAIGGFDGAAEAGVFASLAVVAAPLAIGTYLALAPARPLARRLARAAAAPFALTLLALVLVARGEKLAGLIGLFGALTLALVAVALALALRDAFASAPSAPPA